MSASVQCKLLNIFLKLVVKPKFSQLAATTTLDQQKKIILNVRKKMQLFTLPPPADAIIEKLTIRTIPALYVRASSEEATRTILYLHGGGYAIGSAQFYSDLAFRLAASCEANVLLIDYRLVPEHPLSAALEDAQTAYEWLIEKKSPDTILLAGDSAGGGLALATLVALRDAKKSLPKAAICFSPWTDLCASGKSCQTNYHNDPYIIVPKEMPFLGNIDKRHPYVSPLYANLKNLPPLFIQVGKNEVLLDDSCILAEKAKEAGVDVTLQIWEDVPHVWQLFAKYLPEGKQAIADVAEFVRKLDGN